MKIEREDVEYTLDLCARIAEHTDVPGTITRTFLSPATRRVHSLLIAEMAVLGMQVRVDCAGNVRGVFASEHGGTPRLLMGSHVDTVPNAGAFDGVLGVALALGLVRCLKRAQCRLGYSLEVIAFSEEEGVRFRLPFLGSKACVGTLSGEELARCDSEGISVANAISEFGLHARGLLQQDSDALLSPEVFAFLEVHIEQGPVLEARNLALGVVDAIVGQSRYELSFRGQANHAGTTPMGHRHDALAAAAAWIVAVEELASRCDGLVATVGAIRAEPGAVNVICGVATCSLDVRHSSDEIREQAVEQILRAAEHLAAARRVHVTTRQTSSQPTVAMDPRLRAALARAAESAGFPAHRMPSGAGHDAMIIAQRVPSTMLFVRSPGGVSHHPSESVREDDVQAALATCLYLLQQLDPACYGGAQR